MGDTLVKHRCNVCHMTTSDPVFQSSMFGVNPFTAFGFNATCKWCRRNMQTHLPQVWVMMDEKFTTEEHVTLAMLTPAQRLRAEKAYNEGDSVWICRGTEGSLQRELGPEVLDFIEFKYRYPAWCLMEI